MCLDQLRFSIVLLTLSTVLTPTNNRICITFSGPQKIELASRMVPLVKVVMALLWLIAYPIAKVLDLILHEESDGAENMNRNELSALVRVQYEERMANKRARKMEKVKYQKQKGSFMSINAGGAATTATLTGRATPTDVVVSNVSQTAATANSRVESLNFSQPKNRRFDADAAIRASKHEQIVSEYSGLTNRSSTHDYETSVRSDQSADGRGSGMKRSNSIHIDEVTMVEGALSMKTLRAMDVLTPLHRIYAVPHDLILNEDNIVDIYSSGYSRIPVYQRNPNKPKSQASIIGLLMTKQ
jgi:metal transporter CNNM